MSKKAKAGDGRMPWLRFYGADWRGDAGLRAAGYAARGLWVDMLTLMHEAEPYGHLVVNGQPLDATRLAARLGGTGKDVQVLLDRLEMEGVFSRTADGVIFSRRLVRDKQKADRDRDNGKGGGNPALLDKAEDSPPDNGSDNGGVNPQDKARERAGARHPEARSQSTDPGGSDAAASPLPPSARDLVWSAGLPILQHLTGKPSGACRGILGKLLRDGQDDCPRLLQALQEAQSLRPIEPVPWLTKAMQVRAGNAAGSAAERRVQAEREALLALSRDPDELPIFHHHPEPRRLQ